MPLTSRSPGTDEIQQLSESSPSVLGEIRGDLARRRGRFVAVLRGYFDASGPRDDGMFCVGGFLFEEKEAFAYEINASRVHSRGLKNR